MVVPVFFCHDAGHEQERGGGGNRSGGGGVLNELAQQLGYRRHAYANPKGKGVERARVGVVALARLNRALVEVHHNGNAREEEQQRHHRKIFFAALVLKVHAGHPQQEGQQEVGVAALVVFHAVGQQGLVGAQARVVDKRDAANPVAARKGAVPLQVVAVRQSST